MNEASPSGKDILTWKMNESAEYAEKIINDFDFAKKEFSRAGIEISSESHEEFKRAFRALSESTKNLFAGNPNLRVIYVV
jgi:hypothetical protein